jgi:hypothetical protein
VKCLEGILREAKNGPDDALRFYQQLLEADPSNAVRAIFHLLASCSCCPLFTDEPAKKKPHK